jgi:hypothetical protein
VNSPIILFIKYIGVMRQWVRTKLDSTVKTSFIHRALSPALELCAGETMDISSSGDRWSHFFLKRWYSNRSLAVVTGGLKFYWKSGNRSLALVTGGHKFY